MKRTVSQHAGWAVGLALALPLLGASGCQPSASSDTDHATSVGDAAVGQPDDVLAGADGSANADAKLDPNDPRARPRLGGGETEPAAATRPRLPQRPIRPGVINDITFDDLELKMPLDTMFTPDMLTDRVRQLDKQKVRIRGFIFAGGVFSQTGITSFPLVMNTQCKFGPGGFAYCVILVDLNEGITTDFTTRPVTVEGTLTVKPENRAGFTWSVYHIQGSKVK